MAFGGVATGSMNAIDAASPAVVMTSSGSIPSPMAAPAMIGIAMVEVAVLDVTSVRKMTSVATTAMITIAGTVSSDATTPPIQAARPD